MKEHGALERDGLMDALVKTHGSSVVMVYYVVYSICMVYGVWCMVYGLWCSVLFINCTRGEGEGGTGD